MKENLQDRDWCHCHVRFLMLESDVDMDDLIVAMFDDEGEFDFSFEKLVPAPPEQRRQLWSTPLEADTASEGATPLVTCAHAVGTEMRFFTALAPPLAYMKRVSELYPRIPISMAYVNSAASCYGVVEYLGGQETAQTCEDVQLTLLPGATDELVVSDCHAPGSAFQVFCLSHGFLKLAPDFPGLQRESGLF